MTFRLVEASLHHQNAVAVRLKNWTVTEVHEIAHDAFKGMLKGAAVGFVAALYLEWWIIDNYLKQSATSMEVKRTTHVAEMVFTTLLLAGVFFNVLYGFASRRIERLCPINKEL